MRKMFGLLVIGGLIAVVASDSNAQRPGGGGFGGAAFTGIALLSNKGVQEELKITEEQTTKITTAREEIQKKYPGGFGGGMGKKKTDTPQLTKEEREKMAKERTEATNKVINEILTADQAKRFKQIERQQDVVATLTTDEDAGKEFKLSDEQKEKIKGIVEDNRKEMPKFSKDVDFKEFQEKAANLRKELKEKTLKVLTDEQMKTWKTLTGAEFTVRFEGFVRKKKDD
jgi:Spy/CpxP family protein refolding chaperone